MHAGSAKESGKYTHRTSPLNSYCGGKQRKRDDYKLDVVKVNPKESHSPQFRFTEPNVAVVTQYVCQTKCCLENSHKVKS